MAGVFHELKHRGINCEMVPEYAKEKVWEESFTVLNDQIYVFAKQLHGIRKLVGKVDVIVTDSPILLSLHYAKNETETFKKLVVETHHNLCRSLNFLLQREKAYEPSGRMQTEDEARNIDSILRNILVSSHVEYREVIPRRENINAICDLAEAATRCTDCQL